MYNGKMKILDIRWTPTINILVINCGRCDTIFEFRIDRWNVRCPTCGMPTGMDKLRKGWVKSYE
uniref:Uncharacterized protein n=1 Tax=viral metagenome TaxID=1070528 RepID=A0A6H2A5R6_9ZZZZ